jgi:Holliday junction resolvase RusA-like endonuclease
MIWTLYIPGWIPTPLNKLMGHWGARGRRKAHDLEMLSTAVKVHDGIPQQQEGGGVRQVDILVLLPKGKRAFDPDALFKSTMDGLVHTGVLYNDSHRYVRVGRTIFAKWQEPEPATYITIQELA